MIALDAGIVIAVLDAHDVHHRGTLALLERHADAPLIASALTLAECLVHPAGGDRIQSTLRQIAKLELRVDPVTESAAPSVAGVRASTRLRLPDAVVLHLAESTGAALATTDQRLARTASDRGVTVHLVEPDENRPSR